MKYLYGLFLFLWIGSGDIRCENTTVLLTLQDAFKLAENQSLDALVAKNTILSAYWAYRNYRAELLPNVTLEGTLPALNRSLSAYLKEDGTYGFIKNNYVTGDLTLSVTQNIPFTGGYFSVQSQLQRIDQLGENHTTGYLSVPFSFTYNQPLFTPRLLHWAMRIEPERYKEARQQYLVDMEGVYMNTIHYYFDLLLAKVNLDIAEINRTNAHTLYDIAKGKRSIGLISENDLLQLELNKINAEAEIISVKQNYDNKLLTLCNFLRLENEEEIVPVLPEVLDNREISLSEVKGLAYHNNPLNHTIARRLLEARMRIDEAKANRGLKADIYVSVGYTGSDLTLPDSYRNLQDRQIVSLGVKVPILDWGKGKGKVKLAESEQKVVESQLEQARLNFDQNLVLSVYQFQDQTQLVHLAQQADSIARLRYDTSFQTFLMGTINVLDINSAQVERDNARRKLIHELYLSWLCYYNLRQLTLYDFENRKEIEH
ncbi:MAG: TolC family protein [Candidatus Azobacteroides sp.]|nr:TolC family protein [Candidatus Azobacteroides sp.]